MKTIEIKSPCLKCSRRDEEKTDYSCVACPARSDFAVATQGDNDALERYTAFDYPNLGMLIEPPKRGTVEGRRGRKAATAEHYQRQYYQTVGRKVNEKFGTKSETIKEVLTFLYDKYKSQRHIADNFFGVSVTVIRNMLLLFGIKTLSMAEVKKTECARRRGENAEKKEKTDKS